jgi:putative ABC transport system permease protein
VPRLPRIARRLISLVARGARDRDMDAEMAFHVESLSRQYVGAGMTQVAAEELARRRFGSILRLKEEGHDQLGARLVDDVMRDVRHVLRGLKRTPAFAIAVVFTLAVGIGGNTAIFSIVDQLLLRPLPYPDGEQLVAVYESFGTAARNVVSPANWLDWQRQSRALHGFAAWVPDAVTLTGVGVPARLKGQAVSAEFFPTLGIQAFLGRTIAVADDRPGAVPVVVLSYQLWQRRFGGDPAAIGRIIRLDDTPAQIVGVMPRDFSFIDQDNDLWGALRLDRDYPFREKSGRFINVVARLHPGTTISAARADMTGLASRLAAAYTFNKNTTVTLVPLREELTGQVQTSLLVLYGAVGLLLSIGCFNVANLLLARLASRRRELAIRSSLGAGRVALVRQLVVESLLLAAAGGALGIALARWTLEGLVAFAPPDLLRVSTLSVDRRVLVYALGLSVLTGLVVGIVPAILVTRGSAKDAMRSGGFQVTHAPRVRQFLVACQVALTVVLLCGAGLLVRTLVALNRAGNGFDRHGVLTMEVGLPTTRYGPERTRTFYGQAVAALQALPGVESAAAANSLAVIGDPRGGSWFHRRGTPEVPVYQRPGATIRVVTAGYFHTLRIPVLRGREFTAADDASGGKGFLVNEAFAKAFLSDIDPLSASLTVWMQRENPYLPVIGVVGDVSEGSVRDKAQPTIFYSHHQMPETDMTLVVRAHEGPAIATSAVNALHAIDPDVPVTKVRTFDDAIGESLARDRLSAIVSGAFAASGLLLACLGLYGLLAFLVAERTKELGIRIALGAPLGRLTRSVVGHGLRLVAIGAIVGVCVAMVLLRVLGTLLFSITPYDVSTYAAVLTLLGAVASMASYVPARRAARVEPLVALRQE